MKSNDRQAEQNDPQELSQLKVFAGKWKIEGKNHPIAPNNAESLVHGEDSYEWLNGNYYLVGNWKHLSEGPGHQGVSILGFDPVEKKLFTRNFDNLGFDRKYIFENEGNTWKFMGSEERAIREFSSDGKSYHEYWELKNKDGQWVPLCTMSGTKK